MDTHEILAGDCYHIFLLHTSTVPELQLFGKGTMKGNASSHPWWVVYALCAPGDELMGSSFCGRHATKLDVKLSLTMSCCECAQHIVLSVIVMCVAVNPCHRMFLSCNRYMKFEIYVFPVIGLF